MTVQTASYAGPKGPSWFARAEDWLDQRGKGAWIAAMIVGFIAFWPVGLALLAYMIWSKRMFNGSCANRRTLRNGHVSHDHAAFRASGNTAFDAYKSETLKRLEDEQAAFEAFLQRLRDAKDKSEFDQFMDERARSARSVQPGDTLEA
jgi:cell division protein FtsB